MEQRDQGLPDLSTFLVRFAASSIFLIAAALGMRYPLAWLATPLAVVPVLLHRRALAARSVAGAPPLLDWAAARGLRYRANCPAYPTPVLLRAGRHQAFGDLLSGVAVGPLTCELFNFDWITIGSDSRGHRWKQHHRALVLRARLPLPVPAGFVSLEQRRNGPLAWIRDRIWMPALRGASDVDVRAIAPRLRLRALNGSDPEAATGLLTPELVGLVSPSTDDLHLLTLQIEGDQAAVFASKAVWSTAGPDIAQWMIGRAGPILLAATRAIAGARA
jgi:hypothetical protein